MDIRRPSISIFIFILALMIVGCGSDDPVQPGSGGDDPSAGWVQTNGPPGGEVRAMAFNGAGDIFAGTSFGIFRSLDDGDTWKMINKGLPSDGDEGPPTIYSLYAGADGLLLAGTSEGCSWSVNNGDSWTSSILNGKISGSIKNIIRNPEGVFFALHNSVLLQSTDDGRNWSPVAAEPDYLNNLDCDGSGKMVANISGQGVGTSRDGGKTWFPIGPAESQLNFLAIDSEEYIYSAPNAGSDLPMGVYKSLHGGENWDFMDLGLVGQYRIVRMAFGAAGEIFVNVGWFSQEGGGVYRSADDGQSWNEVHEGLHDYSNLRCLVTSPDGNLYAGTEHGLFRTENSGDQWDLIGLPGSWINSLNYPAADYLFAGTFWEFDVGQLFRSPDDGDTWVKADAGLNGAIVGDIISLTGGGLLAGTSMGLFRSDDGGLNWDLDSLEGYWIPILQELPDGLIYIAAVDFYGSGESVFIVSEDGGVTWKALAYFPATTFTSNGEYLFVGAENEVHRSGDQGLNWTSVTLPGLVLKLEFGTDGSLIACTREGVYRSDDDGLTWQPTGLAGIAVHDFVVDQQGNYLAGTSSGLFVSEDQGLIWALADPLFEGITVLSLQLHPTNGVFAGCFLIGVARTNP